MRLGRILLLDHDDRTLQELWRYLSRYGFAVDCARSLDEAESLWNRWRYQVIITDLRLRGIPETEGLKLVSYIHERCASARLILLTTYGSASIEMEARRRGAAAFLHRPQPREALQVLGLPNAESAVN